MLWRADKKQHTRNKENWIINNTGAILKEKAKITLLFVLRLHHEGVKKTQSRTVQPENISVLQNPRDPHRRHQPAPAKGLYSCCGIGDCKVTVGRSPQLYSLLYTQGTLTQNLYCKRKAKHS